MKLRNLLLIGCLIAITFLFISKMDHPKWNFVGYQYKWSTDYVEKKDFSSEDQCIRFGDKWLEKQSVEEPLYTCASNCSGSGIPGIDRCDKICEYGKKGFLRCRE